MRNLTARLAVRIEDPLTWDFDWSDKEPQRSRSSLTCEDFLPSAADGIELKNKAVMYTMEILTAEFPSFHRLKKVVPQRTSPHIRHSARSEVVPMKILFHDEKYISENIEILTDLLSTASLNGDKQVCDNYSTHYCIIHPVWILIVAQILVGDQMTCKNIRGSKRWRVSEVEEVQQFKWACEVPGIK